MENEKLKTLAFTYQGIKGFAVQADDAPESSGFVTFHVTMEFPLGKLTSVQKVSKQLLIEQESDAIQLMASLCKHQYELKKHEKEV